METVEELINEMLTINPETQLASWEDTINTRRIVTQFMVNMGKRLQAAYKREMAAHKREMADALDTGAFVAEAHKRESVTDCNALNGAKLREALTMLRKKITDWYMNGWIPHDQYDECKDISESALAAPPRNCDKIHDIHEMSIAESPLDMPLVCAPREELLRFIYWLFAEAKGGAE